MILSDKETLKFAIENGIIDINTIHKQIEMNERQKYLEMHKSKIWKSTDGKWYTYITDLSGEKKLIKRNTEDDIKNKIIEFYKESANEPTISEVFYEWANRKLKYKEIQNQTYDRYIIDFKKFYEATGFSGRKVRYLDENSLEDFLMDCIVTNNLKAKAFGNLRTITRGMLLYAKKRGYTNFNILLFLQEFSVSKNMFQKDKKIEEKQVFTIDEMRKILDFLNNDRSNISSLCILLAAYTGMRVGEISALKWEDVHEKYIHVNRHTIIYKDENGNSIYETKNCAKTEAGVRDIVLIQESKSVLSAARLKNPFTEYVFQKDGKPITIRSIIYSLYRVCDKIGIPRRGMHALRKTYSTMLINAGVDESIIINQMGHTDIRTTKNYYYYNNKTNSNIERIISEAINY